MALLRIAKKQTQEHKLTCTPEYFIPFCESCMGYGLFDEAFYWMSSILKYYRENILQGSQIPYGFYSRCIIELL